MVVYEVFVNFEDLINDSDYQETASGFPKIFTLSRGQSQNEQPSKHRIRKDLTFFLHRERPMNPSL